MKRDELRFEFVVYSSSAKPAYPTIDEYIMNETKDRRSTKKVPSHRKPQKHSFGICWDDVEDYGNRQDFIDTPPLIIDQVATLRALLSGKQRVIYM